MSFSTQLWELVRAGFPAIWIQTHEVEEALAESVKISRANGINQIQIGKQCGQHLIVMSPLVKLPVELERYFVVLEHDLPDRDQLSSLVTRLSGRLTGSADGKPKGFWFP